MKILQFIKDMGAAVLAMLIINLLALAIVAGFIVLSGCDTEDLNCPVENRFITEYKEVTYMDGTIHMEAVYDCP